jgi:iron(III) transport system substrate-binding protein
MFKNLFILFALAIIIALPFVFRQTPVSGNWKQGDPVLVIISPHNEAIRYEFERAFSRWHQAKYGKPVKIDWRNIGGTSEIARYLDSEFASAAKPWIRSTFPALAGEAGQVAEDLVKDAKPSRDERVEAWDAFRVADDPKAFGIGIDLFFGGGWIDHDNARKRGEVVEPWKKGQEPPSLREIFERDLIPETLAGESWRSSYVFGTAVSTFGLVYNLDRLRDLGIPESDYPKRWSDLADPRYYRQVGVTDPTKSGSVAKAFELIIYSEVYRYVKEVGGLTDAQIADNEKRIKTWSDEQTKAGAKLTRSSVPDDLKAYQLLVEAGWVSGMELVQRIGGNARYFTDSASKVSIDVSMGDAVVGMSIDFFGRYQAQTSRAPDGTERMRYGNPIAGTSASCDPITLLRGAPSRELACRFIEFVLSTEGQQLWNYRVGAPGGPEKYPLRRLPIRRDFYPSIDPTLQATHVKHQANSTDDLTDPNIDPFQIAEHFKYYSRWTGGHFSVQRELIRAMCLDSGEELRAAWGQIRAPLSQLEQSPAYATFRKLPTVTLAGKDGKSVVMPLTWATAPDIRRNFDALEYMRAWTGAFRNNYKQSQSESRR